VQLQAVDDICSPHSQVMTSPQADSTALPSDITSYAGSYRKQR